MTDSKRNAPRRAKKVPDFDLQKELTHPHDQYAGENLRIKSLAIAFLKYVLKDKPVLPLLDLDKLVVEKRRVFDDNAFKETYADVKYTVPFKDDPSRTLQAVVLIEHKSYDDHWAILQLGYYMMQELFQASPKGKKNKKKKLVNDNLEKMPEKFVLPTIIPIIIHHGISPYTGATRLSQLYNPVKGLEKQELNYEPIIIDLNKIDFENLPDDPNEWRLNVVLRVLKQVFLDNDRFSGVEDCFKRIFPHVKDDPEYARFAKFTIRYFMDGSTVNPHRFIPYISDNYPVSDEGVDTMRVTMTQQLIQEGVKQGIEQGIEQGVKQGAEQERRKERRRMIIAVLEARFGKVPSNLKKQVESINDEVVLLSLVIDASTCGSIKDFQEKL